MEVAFAQIMTSNNTLRIFLVDDDIFYRAIFQQLVNSLGYTHAGFYNSIEEVTAESREQVDVIFIDFGVNASAGIESLKTLKLKNPHIYVVFISATEDADVIASAVKHGAFDYVVKGGGEAERIRKILSKIQQIQKLLTKNHYKLF